MSFRPPPQLDIKTSICMRTTLTLDDDVAAVLKRLRKSSDASLKDLINEALRRGFKDMSGRTNRRERLQTRSVALGRLRIASLTLCSTDSDFCALSRFAVA
jgi:hypothetical protein